MQRNRSFADASPALRFAPCRTSSAMGYSTLTLLCYDSINQLKRKLILDAIEEAGKNYPEAARLLGIHPNYLHRLVRNFDVESE